MKATYSQKALALLLAALLLGGCSSRGAAQSGAQPTTQQPAPQTEEENPTQQQEPTEESAQEEAQTEETSTEESTQEEASTEETSAEESTQEDALSEETSQSESSDAAARPVSRYPQYDAVLAPLPPAVLEQDFSAEEPPDFGNYAWYGLALQLDPDLSAYVGSDGNGYFAPDTIEGLITEHFAVDAEQIRSSSGSYSEQLGAYVEPQGLGGFTPPSAISGASREDNTLVLVVDLYNTEGKIYHTSVLTIDLLPDEDAQDQPKEGEEDFSLEQFAGWVYRSNQTIYDHPQS